MIQVNSGTIILLILGYVSHRVNRVEGFTAVKQQDAPTSSLQRRRPYLPSLLRAVPDDDDDEEDDDDDEGELDSSLGDWRKFRATLIDGGLPGEQSSVGGQEVKKERKAVAEKNEALLAQQNEKLAEEYKSGVWAHTIGQPEVGGLLCRMPFEAELYMGKNGGYWKEKLDVMLSLESDTDKTTDEEADSDTKMLANMDR